MDATADQVHQIVVSAWEQYGAVAVSDLKELGDTDISDSVSDVFQNITTETLRDSQTSSRLQVLVTELWNRVRAGGGFSHPAYREVYVLSQVCLTGVYALVEDYLGAMRALDMAFILGGPPTDLQTMLPLVAPQARAQLLQQAATIGPESRERLAGGTSGAGEERPNSQSGQRAPANGEPAGETTGTSGGAPSCRLLSEACRIHCVDAENLTVKEFRKQYFKADRPVIIRRAMQAWPCMDKWQDLSWLQREHGHRSVPIEIGTHAKGDWREEVMLLSDFISAHLQPSYDATLKESTGGGRSEMSDSDQTCTSSSSVNDKPPAYLAQHTLFDQVPELHGDVEMPGYCKAGHFELANVWLGTHGTATPLHFDSYDNFLCQVVGYKYVRLYSPKQSHLLYTDAAGAHLSTTRSQCNLSQVDIANVDVDKFPLFDTAEYHDTILQPGDMLYIPSKWWHYVTSLTMSFSCNFWF